MEDHIAIATLQVNNGPDLGSTGIFEQALIAYYLIHLGPHLCLPSMYTYTLTMLRHQLY